jgi:hypothetical protein
VFNNGEGNTCAFNGNYIIANSIGDIPVYINASRNDGAKLTLTMVFDPEKFKTGVNQAGAKKYQIICYDRGNAKFEKVCQSLGTTGSFDWPPGKGWLIAF